MNIKAKPLTIDGLMKYLRKNNIKINGSTQKRKLRNIGYYHGYKGYRFINNPQNRIIVNDINEIFALYDFDIKLKSILYPKLMFIETAFKNYTLEELLKINKSDNFNIVFNNSLTKYNEYHKTADKNNHIKKRLGVRDEIYRSLNNHYEKNVVQHFYSKGLNVPLWAIFEIITLGEFGRFISCLNINCRDKISTSIGIRKGDNTDRSIPEKIIFTITDLRNAVAHNDVIYDTRFKKSKIDGAIISWLSNETNIRNITMNNIEDYVILIACILKLFKVSKNEIKCFAKEFNDNCELLRSQFPINYYNQIITTDFTNKIVALHKYIKI
jgi:abortive infection bacteriophage resistance protein